MSERTFSVGGTVSRGWTAFAQQPGIMIGGSLLYFAISFVGGMIPFVSIVFNIVLLPVIMGGYTILVINVVSGRRAEIGDLFAGFNKFGQWLGTYWLLALVMFIAMIPAGVLAVIGLGVFSATGGTDAGDVILAVTISFAVLVFMACMIAVGLIWGLVYWIVADDWNDDSVIAAFKKSAAITRGHRGTLFLVFLVAGLISMAGFLVLFVGAIVTVPLAACILAAAYKELKEIYAPETAYAAGQAFAQPGDVERPVSLTQVGVVIPPDAGTSAPQMVHTGDAERWHYAKGGKSFGPYKQDDLTRFYREGRFGPDDYVFCVGGMQEWIRAGDVWFLSKPAPNEDGPIDLA